MKQIEENLKYIAAGGIGCTFAAVAAMSLLKGKFCDWVFIDYLDANLRLQATTKGTVSIMFPSEWKIEDVRKWLATQSKFHEVEIKEGSWFRKTKRFFKGEKLIGLRYVDNGYTSWITYTGQDAHCKTRLTPHPMLTFRIKKPIEPFYKVGFKNNILYIAQMSTFLFNVSTHKLEKLWETSHTHSKKLVGHELNEEHAAKTTFKIKK